MYWTKGGFDYNTLRKLPFSVYRKVVKQAFEIQKKHNEVEPENGRDRTNI